MLAAIYTKPYILDDINDLIVTTELADYYCALRILSYSLDVAIPKSPAFIEETLRNPYLVIAIAKKLRHADLFKECFTLAAGSWLTMRGTALDDDMKREHPDIHLLILQGYGSIATILAETHQALLRSAATDFNTTLAKTVRAAQEQALSLGHLFVQSQCSLPVYYRILWRSQPKGASSLIKAILDQLLKNNLRLDRSGLGAGEGRYQHHFLCASMEDTNLPWNRDQSDW